MLQRLENRELVARMIARPRNFSCVQNFQTDSGAHPATYLNFPAAVKATDCAAELRRRPWSSVRIHGSLHPFHHMSSWTSLYPFCAPGQL
jgi:hypothetical protein